MKHIKIMVLAACLFVAGCANMNRSQKGAVIGTAAGAGVGAVVGKASGNTAVGAIIGAAVGGTAGALIGNYMDKQAAELQRDLQNARVERVGEGIKITFNSGILFDVDSYALKGAAQTNITDLARVLNKYPDTEVLIEGHTDNTGSDDHNQDLSEKRAESVARYCRSQGVASKRITTQGYGEAQPIEDNNTVSGREQNRRVEVAIFANEKLKKAAKRGDIQVTN